MRALFSVVFFGIPLFLLASPSSRTANVVDRRAIADEKQGDNWLSYGLTYSENRYSPLTSINDHNIKNLGLAWYLDLPNQQTLEATPLAVNGTLYFSGTYGRVFAVDARTGHKLWEFDPDLAHYNPRKLRLSWGGTRGVAYWEGKVYVGTNDGRLLALNAKYGTVVWSVQTADTAKTNAQVITGAPRVFSGKVIVGHSNGEVRTRGYVTAYNADTGRRLWRFYTVPSAPPRKGLQVAMEDMAAKTWSGDPRNWAGGTVWDSIVYDPEFNRVYLGTGNGNPIDPEARSPGHGDNLFLCSIVALDADTGQYAWHYQVTPRDSWDYDATQQMILADLVLNGRIRKVLMQASKNGFFYVIDRATGKLFSAEKYAKTTWADRIDSDTGRPVEMPNARYEKNSKNSIRIWPSAAGAHNWQPMSFDPALGLVYIPTLKRGMGSESLKDPDDGTGALLAWDPVRQRKRWEVHYDTFWNGGALSTAGNLVFQGTGRGRFIAYRATSGEKLWSFDVGLGVIAAPMTYAVDDMQYVSILVGYGGASGLGMDYDYGWRFGEQPRRLLTFALGERNSLPRGMPPRFTVNAVDDPTLSLDMRQASKGTDIYNNVEVFCVRCHGVNVESRGSIAPDLRESRLALNWQAFRAVLRDGTLTSAGMPKFDDLSDDDMRAIYMYIRVRAREAAASARK